jgi:hypothetical protein
VNPEQQKAIRTARLNLDLGHALEAVLGANLIPKELHEFVRGALQEEENYPLAPARTIVADRKRSDWLKELDRSSWHYWPGLRQFLLTVKGLDLTTLRSLDDSSDKILRQLENPGKAQFDIRGLVLGFVQSGKTSNYTALIAKAADAGYRLIIVLSGIDNGLRLQTNSRLKRELVGYTDNRAKTIRMPPIGLQWHEFTRDELDGDFRPGFANHAALQGSQPVLLVVKKNGPVLRRLLSWIDEAPSEVKQTLPFLLIDDEADQASVDTRGSWQAEDDDPDPEYEPPSTINGLIRDLFQKFERRAYVAYTATPFANILIPHDTVDPTVGNDLYPKDFIIDLPKLPGYFGAEEFFGRMDSFASESVDGLDVIREVSEEDIIALQEMRIPDSLVSAISDFVLAGAARAYRGKGDLPATMLIHKNALIADQALLRRLVADRFSELRDEWRYQRGHGIRVKYEALWEKNFRPITRGQHLDRDVPFEFIEPHIGPFFEAVQVREVNSSSGEILNYEREPSLKAIAIGGNKLSRGLTLEGLLVSFFIRRSISYDTLMQMGRWFGFRSGYEDLTRIYTTVELEGWFSDLAFVEHRLREDIKMYEDQDLTPYQVGMRIWQHPTMQVTSPLKRRFSSLTTISQSFSCSLEQTFKFPLDNISKLKTQNERNRKAVAEMIKGLSQPDRVLSDSQGPVWASVSASQVLKFLEKFSVDNRSQNISISLLCAYIKKLVEKSELTDWIVAIRGRGTLDKNLGVTDWGLPTGPVSQISRTRLGGTNSLGVIRDPEDENIGLATEELGKNARLLRPAEQGLLLLYPISRHSGYKNTQTGRRRPLFDNSKGPEACDLVGLAISFPKSIFNQPVEAYLEGTAGWRPAA